MSKRNINHFRKVFSFVTLVVLGITTIIAQEGSATLRGEVLDPSGAERLFPARRFQSPIRKPDLIVGLSRRANPVIMFSLL
jgi:hypothetical protein